MYFLFKNLQKFIIQHNVIPGVILLLKIKLFFVKIDISNNLNPHFLERIPTNCISGKDHSRNLNSNYSCALKHSEI